MKYEALRELSFDERDIQFGKIHTLPELDIIPDEFIVAEPLVIKNQRGLDACTCYAGTAVSEDQELIELDPLWQFAQTKRIMGDMNWGADLRSAAKSFTKYGSIKQKDAPYTANQDRSIVADWKRYDPQLEHKAKEHLKQSYQFITSDKYDIFDSIRATLWYNRDKKQTVITGVKWCAEWTHAAFIDKQGTPVEGHAIKVFGATIKNGKRCLIIQNSYGKGVGGNGLHYFTREIINSGFKYGALTFTDMPADHAKYYQEHNIKADQNWLLSLWGVFKNLFHKSFGSAVHLKTYISILQKVVELMKKVIEVQTYGPTKLIFEYAKDCLGKDMSDRDDTYICMDSANRVVELATGLPIGGGTSTYLGFHSMLANPTRFKRRYFSQPGFIAIWPSGYGEGNGHIGIISDNGKLLSSNSNTGLWDEHLTLDEAKRYFEAKGFPTYFFQVV